MLGWWTTAQEDEKSYQLLIISDVSSVAHINDTFRKQAV